MIIANLTPEDLPWTHIGVQGIIHSGQILEMEDSRARHVLNKMEARGLLRLDFGDNQEEKKALAQQTYIDFWVKQITNFNQDQERRKNTNRETIYPSKQLLDKAKELGVEILGPWAYKPSENTEMTRMQKENSDLKVQLAMVIQRLDDLAKGGVNVSTPEAMKSIEEKVQQAAKKPAFEPKVEAVQIQDDPLGVTVPFSEEFDKLWKTVDRMKKDKFIEWIMENAAVLNDPKTPPALVKRLELKWKMAVPNTDWPLPS
jgi:hypothetical protein